MNTSHPVINRLLSHQCIWQTGNLNPHPGGIATGFTKLDQTLHLGGWPRKGLTELLFDNAGIGELMLLSPTLAQLSSNRWVLLVAPPFLPYAPAWESLGIDTRRIIVVRSTSPIEQLWAAEQGLRSSACAAVLCWVNSQIQHKQLRKLQLAAQKNQGLALLLRPRKHMQQASPAALRIALTPQHKQLQIHVLKQPGGWAGQKLDIPVNTDLHQPQLLTNQLPVYQPTKRPTETPDATTDSTSTLPFASPVNHNNTTCLSLQ